MNVSGFNNGRQATWFDSGRRENPFNAFQTLLSIAIATLSIPTISLAFTGIAIFRRFVLFSCPFQISVCTSEGALIVSDKLSLGQWMAARIFEKYGR